MQVRLITIDDASACNALFNSAYAKNRSLEQWRWEFVPRDSQAPLFAAVEVDGAILGTQALIPIAMIDQTGVFSTAKSEETLLDPSLRGRDFFQRMYDILVPKAEEAGISSIWGFTPATKAFMKAGFEVPGNTSQLFFPLSAEALDAVEANDGGRAGRSVGASARRVGISVGIFLAARLSSLRLRATKPRTGHRGAIILTTLEAPPADAGRLSEAFIRQWGGTTIYRDEQYLSWRYFQNPYVRATFVAASLNDELIGWVAFSLDNFGMGYIVDLIVATPDAADRATAQSAAALLLREATLRLRATGAVGIRCWRVNNHPFDVMLSRVARTLGYYQFGRGNPIVLRNLGGASKHPSLFRFDDWYINRSFTEGLAG